MKIKNGEMSERQAARFIEMYENAMRNGEQWAHDVFLQRGTAKYEELLSTLNEAFEIRSIQTIIRPLEFPDAGTSTQSFRKARRSR